MYVTQASGRSCSCRTEGMSKGHAPCGIRWHLSRKTVWMWSRYHRQRSSVSYRGITVRTHTYGRSTEQAEEEVGYKPPKYAFDLQIMMLPDEGLVLVFSEKEPLENKNGAQLLQALQEMKRVFEEKKAEIGATLGKQAKEETENNAGKNKKAKGKAEEAAKPQFAIFAFRNIGRVIEYAAVLPANLRINSTLYRMEDGTCYVYVQKGGASYERYSRACIQAMEFAALYAADEQKIRYLEEHGECLIREKALKKLRA